MNARSAARGLAREIRPAAAAGGFAWAGKELAFERVKSDRVEAIFLVPEGHGTNTLVTPIAAMLHHAVERRVRAGLDFGTTERPWTFMALPDALLGEPIAGFEVQTDSDIAAVAEDIVLTVIPAISALFEDLSELTGVGDQMIDNTRNGFVFDRRIEPYHTFTTAIVLDESRPSLVEPYFEVQVSRIGATRVLEARAMFDRSR